MKKLLYWWILILCIRAHSASSLPLSLQRLANKQLVKTSSFVLDTKLLPGLNAVHSLLKQQLVLINIVGGMVIIEDFSQNSKFPEQVHIIVRKLQTLSDQGLLPDTTLLLYYGDVMTSSVRMEHLKKYGEIITKMPIFTVAVDRSILFLDNYLLFPSPQMLAPASGKVQNYNDNLNDSRQAVAVVNILNPEWEGKKNKIFWQGSVLDYYNSDIFAKLVSDGNKERLEVQLITDTTQRALLQIDHVLEYMGEAESYLVQSKYKYLLSTSTNQKIDSELLVKLHLNAVLFKQNSGYEEWYYPLLQPYKHFIPIQDNLSDLTQKFHEMQNNHTKAQQIAENSTQFVETMLSPEIVDSYIVYLINQYAQLVKVN